MSNKSLGGPFFLHITNGDSAAAAMREAGVEGRILAWEDALHDGPAPRTRTLAEFSEVRAGFVADRGWIDREGARRRFRARDDALRGFREMREVALWFEHDLYDQLQLIQILDWLARRDRKGVRVSLAQSDDYLAELSPRQLRRLFGTRRLVEDAQWSEARRVWEAFTAPDPAGLEAEARLRDGQLPHLAPALRRHLEEFPWTGDGLNRSERQILHAVEAGNRDPGAIFRAAQAFEEARYMGDWSFWPIVQRLHQSARPLLETENGEFAGPPVAPLEEFRRLRIRLSDAGRSVLAGEVDQILLNGCDRWLGGVRLNPERLWRWHPHSSRLLRV